MLHQEERSVVCPYNPSHVVRQKVMLTHLVKCRKNYPTQDFKICPMDSSHHVPEQEYEYHLENCPQRYVVDRSLIALEPKTESAAVAPPLPVSTVQSLLPPTEESWDDDNYASYDPTSHCEKNLIIRKLTNAPRAKKRDFQLSERRRLIELEEKLKLNGPPGPSVQKNILKEGK